MHETAIAMDICETARSHVPPGHRLVAVVVEYGPLSGIIPEALDFGFSIAAGHFDLDSAKLEARLVPADAECPLCGESFRMKTMWDECPSCGHAPVTVREGGRELRLKEIKVKESADV